MLILHIASPYVLIYFLKALFLPKFHQILWYPIGSYSLVSSLKLLMRSRAGSPPKHNPTKPHCFLTQCPLNPEASRTNVSEETQYTWRPCQRALRPARHRTQESLVRDGTRTSLPAKPSPNPDDAGPIVRRPMGLPVTVGCDRAWPRTQNL
jgi:hypothetical protein